MKTAVSLACIAAFALAITFPQSAAAQAEGVTGTVTGPQHTPIAHATIVLRESSNDSAVTTTASDGSFQLQSPGEGLFDVLVSAPGYASVSRVIRIPRSGDVAITVVLQLASASSLTTISSITVGGSANVSSASAPSLSVARVQLENSATGKLGDVLTGEGAVTPVRPAGGTGNAPLLIALRGPDPTETLVELDGHKINTGATGGFDLSLIDPADLQDVQLVYGIAPSSLVGPDTIGGAINVRTLEPTQQPHSFVRLGSGSFNTNLAAIETTGTRDGIGYAAALDRLTGDGDVNANGTGSAWQSASGLFKVRVPISRNNGFVQTEVLDQATNRDVSASLSSYDPDGSFNSFAGSNLQSHQTLYALDASVPLGTQVDRQATGGTLTFRHSNELDSQTVTGPAQNVSEWYFNYRDVLSDDSLQYDRAIGRGTLTLKYDLTSENLAAPYTLGGVQDDSVARRVMDTGSSDSNTASSFSMTELDRTWALRYLLEPTTHLHYSAAIYGSSYSSFGYSQDPRFGFVWTPTTQTAVRASVGTTFQAPLLTELYVPSPLPPPDANGNDGLVAIGNPHLNPDRATEYDLGFEHIFGSGEHRLALSTDVYQTNLRDAIEQYVPPAPPGYTYPVNLGNVEYRGLEFRADQFLPNRYRVTLSYTINSAFPLQVPDAIQNGALVPNEQFLGTPLHRASIQFGRESEHSLSFGTRLVYEGPGNELNRPPFALLDAHLTQPLKEFNVSLIMTNLTGVYADGFTHNGTGVPYGGPDGAIPTNAYALPPRGFMLSLSRQL
ncbi:MAG TPA: TonB-dependent receptor [Candidatus Baltobacteraceae bacterium]|jgi:outer membrane cobalamin receptor|nr:TonB-dependent receptor [Candidatus Baltobacteraceae bacterium]